MAEVSELGLCGDWKSDQDDPTTAVAVVLAASGVAAAMPENEEISAPDVSTAGCIIIWVSTPRTQAVRGLLSGAKYYPAGDIISVPNDICCLCMSNKSCIPYDLRVLVRRSKYVRAFGCTHHATYCSFSVR